MLPVPALTASWKGLDMIVSQGLRTLRELGIWATLPTDDDSVSMVLKVCVIQEVEKVVVIQQVVSAVLLHVS